jgi:AcrR family transcriptional regulator
VTPRSTWPRILVAARDVFAEQGYVASMEAIAERAEVGVGTLYRRFPHKAELFEAVVDEATRRNEDMARAVLQNEPAREAVFVFMRRCVAAPSYWPIMIEASPGRSKGTGLDAMAPLLCEILARSQRAGMVRADVAVSDLFVALLSVRVIADVFCGTARPVPPSVSSNWCSTGCVRAGRRRRMRR